MKNRFVTLLLCVSMMTFSAFAFSAEVDSSNKSTKTYSPEPYGKNVIIPQPQAQGSTGSFSYEFDCPATQEVAPYNMPNGFGNNGAYPLPRFPFISAFGHGPDGATRAVSCSYGFPNYIIVITHDLPGQEPSNCTFTGAHISCVR